MTNTTLSTEYPKWLRKRGHKDELAKDEAQEASLREKGFSHDTPPEAPSLNWTQPPLAASAAPQPGTVPTATMDAELERMKDKFDRAWNAKCGELRDVQDKHAVLEEAHKRVIEALEGLRERHQKLNADYDALAAENARLLADQNAALKKAAPVKPPVGDKEK